MLTYLMQPRFVQTGKQVHLGTAATVEEELQLTVHWSGTQADC